ncbi:mechanosensitive ion channel [Paracoccus nototheniae]|nr:mechanosensitive ion channel domain-containing protein [Paracoccus nototheniae]
MKSSFLSAWLLVAALGCTSVAFAQEAASEGAAAAIPEAVTAVEAIEEAAKANADAVAATEEAAAAAQQAAEAAEEATVATGEAAVAVTVAEEAGAVIEDADAINWNGSWRSIWRGGQALLILEQSGSTITGTYQPGDATLSGSIEGVVAKGTWEQPGSTGEFEFALAPDGQSFVGRSGNGEYWNGERLDEERAAAAGFGSDTPRAALISLLSAANAAADGDSFAELSIRRYLAFPDGEEDLRNRNARVTQFLRLLNLSTFRALSAPDAGEAGLASFDVGPAGTEWTFPIAFIEAGADNWQLVVPPLQVLDTWNTEALTALEVEDFDALAEARRYGPRQTARAFTRGTATWEDGGAELALSMLDLSEIPENLQSTDGPLAAEYIRQIIDRVGYSIWQEVPDDPNQRQPYIVYEHALGAIAIDRYPQEDGTVHWLFTADSLAAAPEIYDAMQNLALADGVVASEPLTNAFKLRSQLKEISPRLLRRPFLLENWQWIAIAGTLLLTVALSWVIVWLGRILTTAMLRVGKARPEMRASMASAFGWPARMFVAGGILTVLLREIGLRQDVSAVGNSFALLLMLLGGTFFLYRLVQTATMALAHPAAKSLTKFDDIAVELGGGLAKIAVLVGGVVLAADVLGLPYEGVIAGLGVGGLALAIASKDAVSNFIGAGILMSDRSFKRGDLIEGGGLKGVVEEVGMRSTRLRTMDGNVVVVPNVKLADDNLHNWGKPKIAGVDLNIAISIASDTPRAKVDEFVEGLQAAFARQTNARPGARAALDEIGPASLVIKLGGSFDAGTDTTAVKHQLLGDVVDLARGLGVDFAVPTSRVHYVEPAMAMSFANRTKTPAAAQ